MRLLDGSIAVLARPLGEQLLVVLVELAEPLVAELFAPPGALVQLVLALELVVALFELAPVEQPVQ